MITSTANGKVKRLVNLVKKRKVRDQEGVFVTEGPRMFEEAPRERVREVYFSESFLGKAPEIWEKVKSSGIPAEILRIVGKPRKPHGRLLQNFQLMLC